MHFIGNEKSVSLLQKSLRRGALNHAYIFSGPERVGKFTLAKMFALGAIASADLDLDVEQANKDALLDLIVVEPEVVEKNGISKQRDIPIELIRDSKQSLSLFPYHGKFKVLIINDAHRLTTASQNALLKILEEPNPTTILILVTHEFDRILPTIVSRCQVVNFGLVSDEDMLDGFAENFSFSKDCVELAIGRPGLAQFLNGNVEEKNFRMDALRELERIKRGSLNDKFKLAEELSKDVVRTLDKLDIWMWELRKNAGAARTQERELAYEGIEKIQKSMAVLKRTNANGRLILETLFMDL
ncbi:MAG: AAA family ATPase [Candidatus Moranbacteria bacterium]|nr:AAA family ATPase [Candidatus Moranbacteria bacterium]